MKKLFSLIFVLCLTACSSATQFGAGVNITFDPRTIGMQIDDTIMQKSLSARLALVDKKYFLSIQSEVLDGRIFLSGKVDQPEEKIKITKMAWETKGVRSVKNAITIKGQSNFNDWIGSPVPYKIILAGSKLIPKLEQLIVRINARRPSEDS